MSEYINSQKELLKYLKKGYLIHINHRCGNLGKPYSYVYLPNSNKPGITCNSELVYKVKHKGTFKSKIIREYEEILSFVKEN